MVVIGGGISGLICAYRLRQAGISVRLLDAADAPGGVISTAKQDGFLFERGPQSFLSTSALLQLVENLGLRDELLRADDRAPRYIVWRGQLIPAPLTPPALLTTPLLGVRTKWRILTEMFRSDRPATNDESIAAFVRRKFSAELLDRFVAPFVSGIYAGDPEQLSVRAAFPKLHEFEQQYGSVLRGAMKSRRPRGTPRHGLCSFREGMESLPRALGAKLGDSLWSKTQVASLRGPAANEHAFSVEIVGQNGRETLQAGAIVVATPAYAAAGLLAELSPGMSDCLAGIAYAPICVVSAGYRDEQIQNRRNGFGFLVSRTEGLRVLGTVWNSSLFADRAPQGMSSFTSFAGGATDSALCNLDDRQISELVGTEVGRILGVTGPPVTSMLTRYPRALPQYNLGHSATIAKIDAFTAAVPGLFLAGNYLSGPSIGVCEEQATGTAAAVGTFLSSTENTS